MKKLFGVLLALSFSVALMGCNAQQTAQQISNAIAGVLNIAQAEIPSLPAVDQPEVTSFVALGVSLEAPLNSCIAGAGSKKATLLNCFNAFDQALMSPAVLSGFRIVSPTTQQHVQLWSTAISVGVNIAFTQWGGTAPPMPVIASTPTSNASLHQLRMRLGIA